MIWDFFIPNDRLFAFFRCHFLPSYYFHCNSNGSGSRLLCSFRLAHTAFEANERASECVFIYARGVHYTHIVGSFAAAAAKAHIQAYKFSLTKNMFGMKLCGRM